MTIDSYYFLLIIVPMIIGLWAQLKINTTFKKYSHQQNTKGMTGYSMARYILDQLGLQDIDIQRVRGSLSDHYDPKHKVIRLSETVYDSQSIAAIGVSAHECGHALQDAEGYLPMKIRSAIVPIANFGSRLAIPLILIGMLFSWYPLAYIGLIGFALISLFQLITLPVELNASKRAMNEFRQLSFPENERKGIRSMLNAAAFTYIAALISSITQLLHMLRIVNQDRNR